MGASKLTVLILVHLLFPGSVDAFLPLTKRGTSALGLRQATCNRCQRLVVHLQENEQDGSSYESLDDPVALQREIDAMMSPGGGLGEMGNPPSDFDSNETVYNPAPMFTGVIITVLSLLITGYLGYAGLTGDDPLTGHGLV